MKTVISLDFLWYDDPFSTEPKIITWRFLCSVFGVTSSPFLLHATIEYHLERYLNDAKNFAENFLNDLYVDDSTSGFFNVKEAYDFHLNAKQIMKEVGFELRKWVSNAVELISIFVTYDQKIYSIDKYHDIQPHWPYIINCNIIQNVISTNRYKQI